ncbi:hypothetical protein [Streptomyces sp. N35]|uniref:hypothetical protein n=1 Tax=Streptomyces sp. N35 TaxID=2795730 RepID=UPI0018F7A43F|nr:hypothetical protein [Streptomyces sp. N35]
MSGDLRDQVRRELLNEAREVASQLYRAPTRIMFRSVAAPAWDSAFHGSGLRLVPVAVYDRAGWLAEPATTHTHRIRSADIRRLGQLAAVLCRAWNIPLPAVGATMTLALDHQDDDA